MERKAQAQQLMREQLEYIREMGLLPVPEHYQLPDVQFCPFINNLSMVPTMQGVHMDGRYNSDTNCIQLIDQPLEEPLAQLILFHELFHSVQAINGQLENETYIMREQSEAAAIRAEQDWFSSKFGPLEDIAPDWATFRNHDLALKHSIIGIAKAIHRISR